MLSRSVLGLAATAMLFTACDSAPVAWDDAPAATSTPMHRELTLRPTVDLPYLSAPSAACEGSLRLARSGNIWYAVWWSPRADSSALLAVAHTSDEGKAWSPVVAVDSTDRGVNGCRRQAPAMTVDSASGYVHVTYGMVAPEGPGIFFSHSMDGGATFHAPVPILYGERLGRTSVASAGDHVAVAFEDPNSSTPRIGLALSRTMGHIFEDRLLPVSDDNGTATHPLVALQGRRLTVAWQETAAANGQVVTRVRTGTIH